MPRPPFVKAWETAVDEGCDSLILLSPNRLAFGSDDSYGVVDIASGRVIWSHTFQQPAFGTSLAYEGNRLYVVIGKSKLVACDPGTGSIAWSLPVSGYSAKPAIYGDRMLVSLREGTISAVDLRSHRILWSSPLLTTTGKLLESEKEYSAAIAPKVQGTTAVAAQSQEIAAWNIQNGRVLWRKSFTTSANAAYSATFHTLVSDKNRVYCVRDGAIAAFDLRNGTPLWNFPGDGSLIANEPVCVGDLLIVSNDNGVLQALDCRTGSSVWSHTFAPVSTNDRDNRHPISLSAVSPEGTAFVVDTKNVRRIDLHNGRIQWTWNLDQDDLAATNCVQSGDKLVVASGSLLCFRPGTPFLLPADHAGRSALARKLAARFRVLSADKTQFTPAARDVRRSLLKLGDDAFDALLPHLQATALKATEEGDSQYSQYGVFSNIADALGEVMRPQRVAETDALLKLFNTKPIPDAKDNSVRSKLLGLLVAHGDPKRILPTVLQTASRYRHSDSDNYYNDSSIALQALCDSRDPEATQFLTAQVLDPTASATVRSAAFTFAAKTGDAKAIAAVLAVRDEPVATLPSFRTLMNLDALSTTVNAKDSKSHAILRAIRTDSHGTTWGLLISGVLGSYGDLWIAPRTADGKWGDPVFTGVDLSANAAFRSKDRSSFKYQGLTEKQLIDEGAWVEKFVGNSALTQDSDGDGWTDLVEKRLGTNPNHADTDGDGIIDSKSRNPCGARAPIGDAEQVLAAAFDARLRFGGPYAVGPLCVYFPKGTTPFALTGYAGIIIGTDSRAAVPLNDLYGEGVGLVHFEAPFATVKPASGEKRAKGESASDIISWNADRTEATVGISVYYGGLNGTVYDMHLRKINGRWIVIGSRMTLVS